MRTRSDRKYAPSTPPTVWASAAFGDLPRLPGLRAPIPEGTPEAVNRRPVGKSSVTQDLRQRHRGEGPARPQRRREDQSAPVVQCSCPLKNDQRCIAQRDAMTRTSLRALAGMPFPRLAGSRRRQDQEPEAKLGRLARLRPIHGFKRRPYFLVRQRPEVRLDGWHGRQRALDFFPRRVLLDVAMRPAPPQRGALSLLEAVSGRSIRDCERVRHSRLQSAASSALVSRSRAMPAPTGELARGRRSLACIP